MSELIRGGYDDALYKSTYTLLTTLLCVGAPGLVRASEVLGVEMTMGHRGSWVNDIGWVTWITGQRPKRPKTISVTKINVQL